jgi:putative oxidoreductase
MEAELGTFHDDLSPAPTPPVKTSKVINVGDFVYSFARIVIALIFALHGAQKLFGLFGGLPAQHDSWRLGTGILEFVGGVALALGFFTRPISLVLFSEMAWVYYQACLPGGLWPIPDHGEFAAAYCAFFLILAAFGPGNVSIERMAGKRRN